MSTHNQTRNGKKNLLESELDDLLERVNMVELELVDAKEFSHLSSDAFEALQTQINELREMVETVLSLNTEPTEVRPSPYEYL